MEFHVVHGNLSGQRYGVPLRGVGIGSFAVLHGIYFSVGARIHYCKHARAVFYNEVIHADAAVKCEGVCLP